MKIGYARVSTQGQKLDPQIEMLKNEGCEKIFSDIGGGVRSNRSGLEKLLANVRKDDVVVVYKIDRIFRSLKNLVELVEFFNSQGVKFKSISEPAFDTTSSNGKFVMQIFGAVAEFERNLISERTKMSLESARRRNQKLGRPLGVKKETLEKYEFVLHLYKNKKYSIIESCNKGGISKATFYRIDRYKKNSKGKLLKNG